MKIEIDTKKEIAKLEAERKNIIEVANINIHRLNGTIAFLMNSERIKNEEIKKKEEQKKAKKIEVKKLKEEQKKTK